MTPGIGGDGTGGDCLSTNRAIRGRIDGLEPSPPLLSVESLRVEFGTLRAVDDVSLMLRGGDLLGLIGPNGAGKTTLLRAIAALQPIHLGSIHILGQELRPEANDV